MAKIRRRYPLLFFLFIILSGQVAQVASPVLPSAVAISLYLYSFFVKNRAIFIVTTYMALSAGVLTATLSSAVPDKALPTKLAVYAIQIEETPRHTRPGEVQFIASLIMGRAHEKSQLGDGLLHTTSRIFCRAIDLPWREAAGIQAGDLRLIKAELSNLEAALNPFSFEQALRRKGVKGLCKVRYLSMALNSSVDYRLAVKKWIAGRVEAVAGSGESAGLFMSMALGKRDVLSRQTEEAFKNTGMAHLLVVSGYQMTLIYSMISALASFLLVRVPGLSSRISIALLSALGGLGACIFYSLLTSFEQSSGRALCAIVITVTSRFLERGNGFLTHILAAFFFVQIIWPLSFLEPSVQLTFAALLGLQLAGDNSTPFAPLRSCLMASYATSLVSVCWFGTFSLIGFILNPILAALVSVISCKVGFFSLLLLVSGIDSSGIVLTAVINTLEIFRDLIVYCSALPLVSIELDDWRRVVFSLLVALPMFFVFSYNALRKSLSK